MLGALARPNIGREPKQEGRSHRLAGPLSLVLHRDRSDVADPLKGMIEHVSPGDPYAPLHPPEVADLCGVLLRALGADRHESAVVLAASRFHDLTRIRLPRKLIHEAGDISAAIYLEGGAEPLQRHPDVAYALTLIRHHHERWDGRGYPDGLKGNDIPLGARIIAVADAFCCMTRGRLYRKSFSTHHTLRVLHEGRGRQWDPAIVDVLQQTAFVNDALGGRTTA